MNRTLTNLDATRQAAVDIAAQIRLGDVIALTGALGAGKTTLVRYLVEALGGIRDEVTSPTFSLIDEHTVDIGLFVHCDLYRVESHDELVATGLFEYLGAEDCVVAIEWPQMGGDVRHLATCGINFELAGDARIITFERRAS